MRRLLCTGIAAALLAACAHDSSLNARLAGAAQLVRDAEDDLKQADRRIQADDLDKAGELLADARTKVEDRQMAFYADRENIEDRLAQAEARLAAAKDSKVRREIAARVPEQKEKAERAMSELRATSDALRDRASLDRMKAQRARAALEAATRLLDDSKRFEIDAGWAAYAKGARAEIAPRAVQMALAEALLAFLEGPVAKGTQAKELFERAKSVNKAEERTALYTQSRESYLACGKDAGALLAQTPPLEREPLSLSGGRKATTKAFAAGCDTQVKVIEDLLNPKPAKPAKAATKPTGKKK